MLSIYFLFIFNSKDYYDSKIYIFKFTVKPASKNADVLQDNYIGAYTQQTRIK